MAATWMKKVFTAEGVTEYPPGPAMPRLQEKFGNGGAVVLALDVSGSMLGNLDKAVRGCQQFMTDAVGGGYQVGVILWDHGVVQSVEPRKETDAAYGVLCNAQVNGGTNVVPALVEAESFLVPMSVGDKVIAVFGDGDLGNERDAIKQAKRLEAQGIRIITMGLGSHSAQALSVISTEMTSNASPRTASTATLTEDIKGLVGGLRLRRPGK